MPQDAYKCSNNFFKIGIKTVDPQVNFEWDHAVALIPALKSGTRLRMVA